jgi:hypothetical protein
MSVTAGCPPGGSDEWFDEVIRLIVEFWNQLRVCEELGATNWGVLEPIEREVTECLYRQPRDIRKAESLTALAMLLIAARSKC